MSNQNRVIRRRIRKPHSFKARRYAARLVFLNEYLDVFPGVKICDKICVTEIYGIILNIMPNICINLAYVQGFDYEYITFKAALKFF